MGRMGRNRQDRLSGFDGGLTVDGQWVEMVEMVDGDLG